MNDAEKFGRLIYLLSMSAGKLSIRVHPKIHQSTIMTKKNIIRQMIRRKYGK